MLIYTALPLQTSKDEQIWFHCQEGRWVSISSIFSEISSIRQEVSGTSVIPPRGKFLNTPSFSCATYFSAVSLAYCTTCQDVSFIQTKPQICSVKQEPSV